MYYNLQNVLDKDYANVSDLTPNLKKSAHTFVNFHEIDSLRDLLKKFKEYVDGLGKDFY